MVNQRISLKDIDISINGKIIGGAEEASVKISRDDTVAYEGGSYMPVEIVGGKFAIDGSLKRAFIDVTLLNEIMPHQSIPASFTLTALVSSGKSPARNISIFGVVFKSVDVNSMTMDGYAKNDMEFNATNWRFD